MKIPKLVSVAESVLPLLRYMTTKSFDRLVNFTFAPTADYLAIDSRSYFRLIFGDLDYASVMTFCELLKEPKYYKVRNILLTQLFMCLQDSWFSQRNLSVSVLRFKDNFAYQDSEKWELRNAYRIVLPVLMTAVLDPRCASFFTDLVRDPSFVITFYRFGRTFSLVFPTGFHFSFSTDRAMSLQCLPENARTSEFFAAFGRRLISELRDNQNFSDFMDDSAGIAFCVDALLFLTSFESCLPEIASRAGGFDELVRAYLLTRRPRKKDPTRVQGVEALPESLANKFPHAMLRYAEDLGPLCLELRDGLVVKTGKFNWEQDWFQ